MKVLAATAGAIALAAGALVAGGTVVDVTPEESVTFVGPAVQETLAEGQYVGPCSIVTPPEPDPCEAAQGQIRYAMLGELVNAIPYKNWRKGAPIDAARLDALMLNPQCPTASNPQPQTLRTFMGAAIGAALQAYACAKGTGPITWPAPNPPPVAGSDTQAPTPPGPVTVTP